ncbi:MAG: C4-type zinc ribbon domain-containing protein [Pseudomonadota bacterium]
MGASLYVILNDIRQMDDKIKVLNKKKSEKPALLSESRKKLSELETKNKSKAIQLDTELKKYKHIEGVVVTERDKLEKAEMKLNAVKNSKEYQAALKELNQFKKTVSNLDEQKAAAQVVVDTVQKEFNTLDEELKKAAKEFETVMVSVKDEIVGLDSQLSDITESREKMVEQMPVEIKVIYRKAYTNKGGVGVAVMNENRCGACNMSLPMQLCNEILKGDKVHHCPSCQRLIIYISKE